MIKTKILVWFVLLFCFLFFACACCCYLLFPFKYKEIIVKTSKNFHLEPSLVFAVVNVESHFNKNAVSRAGAQGLMQLLPSTATELNENEPFDLFDAQTNINLGCKYLHKLVLQFEDISTALASYNAGPANVLNWLSNKEFSANGKTLDHIPFKETREYVRKVLKTQQFYNFLLS